MKTIRRSAFVILLLSSSPLLHADVTVTESARVLKDGADIGAIPDAVKNGVVTPTEVQAAVLALIQSLKTQRDAANAHRAEVLTKLDALDTGTAAEKKAAIAALKATEKERRKAEIQARIDAANKELIEASK